MLEAWIALPNPPDDLGASPPSFPRALRSRRSRRSGSSKAKQTPTRARTASSTGSTTSNRSKRRKKRKAMRRARDRRGRYLRGGKVRSTRKKRSSSRRRRSRSQAPRRRRSYSRRRRSYSSNPPRRRRSYSRRRRNYASNPPRRRRSHGRRHSHGRRRRRHGNPPYTLKHVAVAAVSVVAGAVAARGTPWAVAKITGDATWNMGWASIGLEVLGTLLFAGAGYGVARLAKAQKRTAFHVASEIAIGGLLVSGYDAYVVWSATPVAPAPAAGALVKSGTSGMGLMTPQQLAQAKSAARMLGVGNISPQAYSQARKTVAFSPNEKF